MVRNRNAEKQSNQVETDVHLRHVNLNDADVRFDNLVIIGACLSSREERVML